jgi:hypothetical protein
MGRLYKPCYWCRRYSIKNSKPEVNKKDMTWLQLIEKKAEITLKNTNPLLQAHAQIKIDMLQQEAAALQTLL